MASSRRSSSRATTVLAVGVLLCAVLLVMMCVSVSASSILKVRSPAAMMSPDVDLELMASTLEKSNPVSSFEAFAHLQSALPAAAKPSDRVDAPSPFLTLYASNKCAGTNTTVDLSAFNGLYNVCISAVNSTDFFTCSIQVPGNATIAWAIFLNPNCIVTDLTAYLYAMNVPVDANGCFNLQVLTPSGSAILAAQMACPLPKSSPAPSPFGLQFAGN